MSRPSALADARAGRNSPTTPRSFDHPTLSRGDDVPPTRSHIRTTAEAYQPGPLPRHDAACELTAPRRQRCTSPRYRFRGPAMGCLAPGSGMAVCPLSKSMTWGVLPPGFGAPLDR